MRKFVSFTIMISAALAVAAPTDSAPPAPRHPRGSLASMLNLRLRSIELQIDILSDRVIGREEAQELRGQARRLEQRLNRSSEREAVALEPEVERLQQHLRLAADEARLGTLASRRRDLGGFDDGERYERERDSDYAHDSYQRADPRGDPFAIWKERDERGPH